MTTTVTVHTCGDHWIAVDETLDQIRQADPDRPLILDLRGEGPNLTALGVVDAVLAIRQDPGNVWVKSWINNLDPVPFLRIESHLLSHFFWMSQHYQQTIPVPSYERRFGMFCGRLTYARAAMLYDSWHNFQDLMLLSLMRSKTPPPWATSSVGRNLESFDDWIDLGSQARFKRWWLACPVGSLDGHWTHDQYDPQQNTNRDLLAHYRRFDIEIVMETVTVGPAFFPTEKTVRPISANKALLVYGPRGFLANLRGLGFRTWHSCWDESYDDLEGPARWRAMRSLLRQDLREDPEISQHNLHHLSRLIRQYQPT